MLIEEKLQRAENLSDSQRSVAEFMLREKEAIAGMTLRAIAEATYTSPATLVRLAKNLGYEGFEPLRQDYLREREYLNHHFIDIDANMPFSERDSDITIASKIAALVQETVKDTLSLMNHKDLSAALAILKKAERVHLSAISFPLIYGMDFQMKMRRLGKDVCIVGTPGEQLFSSPIIGPKDCAMVISYSGETETPRAMVELYKRKKIPIIAVTSVGNNYVRENATIALSVTTREKLYSKIAGYSSEYSIKLVLDVLYSCYFSLHYNEFFNKKIALSKTSEPGRNSTSQILMEK